MKTYIITSLPGTTPYSRESTVRAAKKASAAAKRMGLDGHILLEVRGYTSEKCACGASGSFASAVFGQSSGHRAVWAGCPYCNGRALGTPIPAALASNDILSGLIGIIG